MSHQKIASRLILTLMAALAIAAPAAAQTDREKRLQEISDLPNDEFYLTITEAGSLLRRGRIDQAIEAYRKAAKLKNDLCAECFRSIGMAYFGVKRYNEAAEAFRQAIALKPDNEAELQDSLGVTLYLCGDKKLYEPSITAFKLAIELSGGKLSRSYYNLGHALLKTGREQEGVEALKSFLAAEPDAETAAEVKALIANPKMTRERVASAVNVKIMRGEDLSLEELRGKVVLLDFWATWCGPCRAAMPGVKELWRKYGGDRFVIIGVSLDHSKAPLEDYVKHEGITWPQYYDGSHRLASLYNVRSIPHTVLIDQAGKVEAVGLRGSRLASRIDEMVKSNDK